MLLVVTRVPKLYYTTYISKLASMADLHPGKCVSVVRRNGCDKAVSSSGCEGRSAWVEGHLCHSNLFLGPLNNPSSFPCNYSDYSPVLLAPALPEMETPSSPFAPGIFIELVNQQQLPQGSSWHKRQGTRAGSHRDSGAVSQEWLPPPWDCRYQPRLLLAAWALPCPGHAATVQGRRCCWDFPPRTAASSQSQVHLQETDKIFALKIHPETTGEAQAGKTSMGAFSRPKLFHLHDK